MEQLSQEFQDRVRREALAIRTDLVLEIQQSGDQFASKLPLIWVNADTQPDIANLWKTHEQYGEGDQSVRWLYLFNMQEPEETAFYLDIQVQIPKCSPVRYFVAFPLIEQEELVESLAKTTAFSIMTDPDARLQKLMERKERTQFTAAHLPLIRQGVRYENLSEADRRVLIKMLNQWRGLMGKKKH